MLADKAVRNHRLGIVLLSTLVSILLLSSLIVVLQKRAQGNVMILARLEKLHREAPHKDAVFERLRGLVADAMTGGNGSASTTPLDGTPIEMTEGKISWKVKINDVQGLVDIYLAPITALNLLPLPTADLQRLRDAGVSALPPGSRYAVLAATLARFGLGAEQRSALEPFLTQSAQSGAINVDHSPTELRRGAGQLGMADRTTEQVQTVRISISD